MPETPNPSPEKAPAPGIPPVDLGALLATFLGVLKGPAQFYTSIKEEKGFVKVLTFSIAMGAVYGVLRLIWWPLFGGSLGWGIRELIQSLIFGAVGPFVGGAIVWIICMFFGSKAPYEPSARIAGYASAVLPVIGVCLFVKWIGWIAALVVFAYGVYIAVIGARTLNFEPPPPAATSTT